MLISQESADLISSEISTIMCRPTFLVNEEGVIISSTDPTKLRGVYPQLMEHLAQGQDYVALGSSSDNTEDICFPIWLKDRIIGAIGIVSARNEREELVTHYSGTIQRIAQVRIQRLSRRMSRDEEQGYFERARQIFFESTLFSGTLSDFLGDDDEIVFRASLLGIDLNQPRVIAVLGIDGNPSSSGELGAANSPQKIGEYIRFLRKHIAHHPQHFCFVDDQHIVILFCADSTAQVLEACTKLCETLENFYSVKVYGGIGTAAQSPAQFQRCYMEASTACGIAQRAAGKRLLVYDVRSPLFIAQTLTQDVKSSLIKAVFNGLSEEEVQEIVELVQVYAKYDGNIEQSAAELFMHRNTFLYRINKIRTLTGLNIKSPKDFLILYLAASNIH